MYYRNTKEFCSDSSRSQVFRNIAYTNVNIMLAKFLEKKPNGQWVSINAKTDFLRIETQLLSFLDARRENPPRSGVITPKKLVLHILK